ncbi:MAG: iron-containing alcohol dehydrogenase [Actinomycetota bacterium]|nr:iron-containing alcohol dehydrogenase [Actinomycetota bacterium]
MDQRLEAAARILKDYKKDNYCFGQGCSQAVGNYCLEFGQNPLLMISERKWADTIRKEINGILDKSHINRPVTIDTPPVDNPVNSVMATAKTISQASPDLLLAVGGGSAIDCIKAANVAASLDAENLEPFLGIGKVSEALKKTGKKLYPMVAVQTIAGSGSHLSKNSVINYPRTGQKKIITDMALVPDRAVFDYSVTTTMGRDLTLDGALDGFSHCLEVYYGSGDSDITEQVCLNCISLVVDYLPLLLKDLDNPKYRHAIGLATDLGGYALMLGGTSGPHLNSFSMVELTSHGQGLCHTESLLYCFSLLPLKIN